MTNNTLTAYTHNYFEALKQRAIELHYANQQRIAKTLINETYTAYTLELFAQRLRRIEKLYRHFTNLEYKAAQ